MTTPWSELAIMHPHLLLLLGREDVDDAVDRRSARSACAASPKTRWPVSAAVSAVEIVSRSRISPTRITSGSWRSAARRASANVVASGPISRWLTMHRLCRCRNSIGSSIVRMCSARLRLISSIIAASVVDLPEPVGPVTRTRPRGFSASWCSVDGMPSSSSVLSSSGIMRNAAPTALPLEVDVDAEAREARDRVARSRAAA